MWDLTLHFSRNCGHFGLKAVPIQPIRSSKPPCLSRDAFGERLPDAVVVVCAVESAHGGDARVGERVGAEEPHHSARQNTK